MAIRVIRSAGEVAITRSRSAFSGRVGACLGVGATLAQAKQCAIDELNADMAEVLALDDSAGAAGNDQEEAD